MPGTMRHVISICGDCEGDGAALAAAVAARDPGAEVRVVPCMNLCSRPVTVAARAEGKAAYLFGGVTPDEAEAVATFARMYAQAPDGVIADARPLGRLRLCLIGRIPA
ncbi:DUF1636 family protein [Pseudooceanicola pacificus]|nr:DUF1636 family protein [Pseudooceanicola pacificus]